MVRAAFALASAVAIVSITGESSSHIAVDESIPVLGATIGASTSYSSAVLRNDGASALLTEYSARETQSRPALDSPGVGALFSSGVAGAHFCTASLVDSPNDNVLITAAHCIYSVVDGFKTSSVFVPDYHNGAAPYGQWHVKSMVVDQRWLSSSDPDDDFGFIVLQPRNGKELGDVVPGNVLAVNATLADNVDVTGYPTDSDIPITCRNEAAAQGGSQLRFSCAGYASGTSGSPWVVNTDPLTHTGEVVGVIGGFEQGGDSDDVSYSPRFSDDVAQLFRQAVAESD